MLFANIPGLQETKDLLIRSVNNNHVAHAQLFHGLDGSANLAMALAFATYLNCEDKQETDACGKCSSCLKIKKLAHPDVTYIFPTAGGKKVLSENFMKEWREFVAEKPFGGLSDWLNFVEIKQGNIPVEEARQLIQNLSLKSYEGGYKIVIIWQAENLHTATANALLKILEEPPEQTLFLLVCNSMDRLLTTIISRAQRVAIRNFSQDEVIKYLMKKGLDNEERAAQIAFLSDGDMNKAEELMEQKIQNEQEWFANWMRYCYAFDVSKLIPLADEFDTFTKETQKGLFEYGLRILRELFLYTQSAEQLVRIEGEELVFVQKFSKVFNIGNLEHIIGLISEAHFHIERNVRAKIAFLDTSLSISRLIR
jgi:DNA polymerase-3 subunit delta'